MAEEAEWSTSPVYLPQSFWIPRLPDAGVYWVPQLAESLESGCSTQVLGSNVEAELVDENVKFPVGTRGAPTVVASTTLAVQDI